MWAMTTEDWDMDLDRIPEPTAADLAALEDESALERFIEADLLDLAVSLDELMEDGEDWEQF